MKKQLLFICMIVHTLSVIAGTMQETFLKGNAAYLAGKMDEALKLYQSMEPKGPAVAYNMGNCYFRIGKYPEAIVQWRRAQKDASWRDFAVLDSYIAQSYDALGIVRDQSFMTRMQTWLARPLALFSIFVLQLLFLFCWIGLFFVYRDYSGNRVIT